MLKNFWTKILAVIIVVGFLFVGASKTEAATLKTDTTKLHKATMVVEDVTHKNLVRVTDLTGIKKMSVAVEWIEENAFGRNLRFISTDLELLKSWKHACQQATRTKASEIKDEAKSKKISEKSKKALKQGNKYFFELKSKKSNNQWSASDVKKATHTVKDVQRVLRY